MLDFWLRVKDKLDFQDSTQRDLAQNINESYNTLQSWINRDRLPNAEQAVKIADGTNTNYVPTELLPVSSVGTTNNGILQFVQGTVSTTAAGKTTLKTLEEAIENLQKEMQ